MREEFEEKLRKQREEMTAEMTKEMNAKIQDLMASVCVPGNFQQVLLGGELQQAGTSSSAAPAPQGPPAPENKVIYFSIRRIKKCG